MTDKQEAKDTLAALIEKLEKAEGPDEVLDEAIFEAVFGNDPLASPGRRYSGSVDAALTLVPEGWSFYRLDQYHDDRNPAWGWGATLRCHARPDTGTAIGESQVSMPVALCIAALKARASMEKRP